MAQDNAQAEATLNLHFASGLQLAADGVRLLEAVAAQGSITGAAKAVGISYRTAWQRIESLNNLAEAPLVERATGGAAGGGTRVTAAGERLLAQFHTLEREHQRFLQRLSEQMSADEAALATLGRISMQTSARNQFHGRIQTIKHGAVNAEVVLTIGGHNAITAVITEDSLARLGLAEGGEAIAMIKASSVILTTQAETTTSASNHLTGTIARLHEGTVNTDVVLDIGGGKSVGAIVTNDSAQRLALCEGGTAGALFKASSVILALPG